MPRKVLPDSEIDQLARQGKTDAEIAAYLLTNQKIDVTPNAITAWRRRRGDDYKRPRYPELLPWRVKTEHSYLYTPKMLRILARVRQGLAVNDRDRRRLEVFMEKLEAANAVVHYDPDTEQGWWFVTREPGDKDIIRQPGA